MSSYIARTLATAFVGLLFARTALAVESASARALFADPPRHYSSGPLWVWNDMLTEEQIRSTLRDLAGQKVKQAFVHPRPGLMTPYLSEDWFRLWKVALDEAERLDMNVWIYDENSYPSGFAGGLVPEAMPESRGRGLTFRDETKPQWDDGIALVYRLTDDGYVNVTEQARSRKALPKGRYLVANWQFAESSGWFAGKYYVDLLKPGVTEKFIEITFDAYDRQVGDQFGRRIPGIFTDEPHLWASGGVHWNEHLREKFRERWDYDMEDHFPALVRPLGDWRRVRHNYQQLLLEQFIERWGKPCYEWCERHALEFTGHYWEHGWPEASHGPDNMAMYAWHQRPAIDILMNDYGEEVHGQFGNSRSVKELSSVANQLGRRRTLCEAYGAAGWDLRFEDMKRIGDWLYVLGVNTLNEHLSYTSIRGARKRDHPQSFSYHEPWWDSYHVMAQYFSRLSLCLSEGEQVNSILVLEPTTTAWIHQPDSSHRQQLDTLGQSFQDLINRLEAAQVEYDLGSEDIIARHGSIRGGRLTVGKRQYNRIVLPPMTENLNASTIGLLEMYVKAGGQLLCCGDPPPLVDGSPSQRCREAAREAAWTRVVDLTELPQTLLKLTDDGFSVHREGDQGILFHHRRHFSDGQMLFLINTSIEESCACIIQSPLNQLETWHLESGNIVCHPPTTGGTRLKLVLPPCGSKLLFLRDRRQSGMFEPGPGAGGSEPLSLPVASKSPTQIKRLGLNVLTLDYVDVRAGAEEKENVYFYLANRLAFVTNGLERNPWDSAVQLRDEFIQKTFPKGSGFTVAYRFTVEDHVPERLWIVIERPDLYSVTCNAKPVRAGEGQWWLDKSFGKIDISSAAKVGENTVTLRASPFTMYHEVEPAYVLGDFALRPVKAGFAIVPDRTLQLGPWNEQGHPLYGAGVAYVQKFEIAEPSGRYFVHLPNWYGSVARVRVNSRLAGHIAWQPWECEVTDSIHSGENTIEVELIGTLKNTLGPHHGSPQLGRAWPDAFRQAPEKGPPPGDQYHTVAYGLFAPFMLRQLTE